MKETKSRGKATVTKRGDVTTVRVVNYRGKKELPPVEIVGGDLTALPDLETLKHVDIVAFNQSAEKAFLIMLSSLCEKMPDGVPIVGARAETAFRLNVSTETAKRYIEKFCFAFSAPFCVKDGMIYKKAGEK